MTASRKIVTMFRGGGSGGGASLFTLTATTTAPSETVTLQRITPTGGDCVVDWGDGEAASTITDGNTGTTTHIYASADTYNITITNPDLVTYFDIRDTKLGCAAGEIGSLTNLEYLNLYGVTDVTVGAGEIGSLTSLTYLKFYSVPNVTVGAGEIGSLTSLTSLYIYNSVNVTVGAGEIGLLTNLTYLYLGFSANVAAQTGLASLLKLTTLLYENNLTQPQVDSVLAQLYVAFPTRTGTNGTVDLLGGSNAAPTGTSPGSAECAPTTGWNTAYELVNDSCGVSLKHWASVTLQT